MSGSFGHATSIPSVLQKSGNISSRLFLTATAPLDANLNSFCFVREIIEDTTLLDLSTVRDAIGCWQRERCDCRDVLGQSTVPLNDTKSASGQRSPLHDRNYAKHQTQRVHLLLLQPNDRASRELLCLYV